MATRGGTAGGTAGPLYDREVALEFFKAAGKPESVTAGKTFFSENQKALPLPFMRDKMYLLLEGEVELQARKKKIGSVAKGSIFGEMASITHAPRSATAVAKTACRVLAVDDKQFLKGLEKKPAFALMLMSIMIQRLRDTITALAERTQISSKQILEHSATFDPKRLAELSAGMSDADPVHYDKGKVIVEEGQTGLRMYAVLEGVVTVFVNNSAVERLGPGGVFGELALLEQSPRLASVVAETDCELLPISRQAFLLMVKTNSDFASQLLGSLAERLRVLTARLK
jgi:CRP/FNR family cyclic AMP-dependent transcriptional regulator